MATNLLESTDSNQGIR